MTSHPLLPCVFALATLKSEGLAPSERERYAGAAKGCCVCGLERYDRAECRVWERSDDAWSAPDAWGKGMAKKIWARNPEAWDRLVQKYPGLASQN